MSDYERGETQCEMGLQPAPDQTKEYYDGYGHKYTEIENSTAKLTQNEKVNHYEC